MVIDERSLAKVFLKKCSKNFICLTLSVLLSLLFFSCARNQPSQIEFALGTVCEINLYEGGNRQLYSEIFKRLREIDRTMTAYPPINDTEKIVSDVMAINICAGIGPVLVGDDLIEVLETALHYAELSDGTFDPTIGPLVKLWGIGTETQRIPGDNESAAAL
jgi:thiamine biosynthesis lipoprotein